MFINNDKTESERILESKLRAERNKRNSELTNEVEGSGGRQRFNIHNEKKYYSDQMNSSGFKLNVNSTIRNKISNLNAANLLELPFFSCLNNELTNELNEINYSKCPDYISSFKALNDNKF